LALFLITLADSALSHRVAVGEPFSIPDAVIASSASNADQHFFVIRQIRFWLYHEFPAV